MAMVLPGSAVEGSSSSATCFPFVAAHHARSVYCSAVLAAGIMGLQIMYHGMRFAGMGRRSVGGSVTPGSGLLSSSQVPQFGASFHCRATQLVVACLCIAGVYGRVLQATCSEAAG